MTRQRPDDKALARMAQTMTKSEIADATGVGVATVGRWLAAAGITLPLGNPNTNGRRPTGEQQFVVKERREPTPPQKRDEFIPVKVGGKADELRSKARSLPPEQQAKVRRLLYLYRQQQRRYQRGVLPW